MAEDISFETPFPDVVHSEIHHSEMFNAKINI